MPAPRRLAALALLCLALPAGTPTAERRDEAVYDFYARGLHLGTLVFAGVEAGDYYAVNGRFSTAGLASLVRSIRYDATVRGHVADGTLHPREYVLTTHRGKAEKVQTITFSNGAPQPPVQVPPRAAPDPLAVKPAAQVGSVDTLTAIYATLRVIPAAMACKADLTIYDGVRRARLTLWPTDGAAGVPTCGGEYRRIAGYSAEDMAHPSFAFRLTYSPVSDGQIEAQKIVMDSIYGPATLKRR